jgi:hypothetical protein
MNCEKKPLFKPLTTKLRWCLNLIIIMTRELNGVERHIIHKSAAHITDIIAATPQSTSRCFIIIIKVGYLKCL